MWVSPNLCKLVKAYLNYGCDKCQAYKFSLVQNKKNAEKIMYLTDRYNPLWILRHSKISTPV